MPQSWGATYTWGFLQKVIITPQILTDLVSGLVHTIGNSSNQRGKKKTTDQNHNHKNSSTNTSPELLLARNCPNLKQEEGKTAESNNNQKKQHIFSSTLLFKHVNWRPGFAKNR